RSPDVAPPARMLSDDDRAWSLEPGHAAALQAVATKLGRATVLPNENLELDLGLDSLERVELLTELEQRNGTKVGADVRARIFTVRQLVDAVNGGQVLNRTDARQAPHPAAD